ncbi:HAMP domain-containing protein [Roseococcus sp. SYP-B2431]|uniref:ATP-binding protein n=1 Tax=Roseococcus sp. SYP-B2431 TaxID=2496640 RepID=UPI00103D2255|nr:ATP-binding protein [Roseococcus sp. SYP-B2431]TCH96830.1 HAMP domain-containing protein [Roseococcus sp. SYP-B2431]
MSLWNLVRPDSLAGRTMLVLVGGLTLLDAGSMLIHDRALHRAELLAFETRLADRILAASAVSAGQPEAERDTVVREWSLPGLELRWRATPPSAPVAAPHRFPELFEQLGESGPVVRAMVGAAASGAVAAPGGGWIHFAAQPPPYAGFPVKPGHWLPVSAMALGILLVAFPILGWMTQPLRRLAEAADRLGRDPRPAKLPTTGPVEVRHAAQAFNAMQARIARLIEDRTEALAALSHDFRTPLARLRLRAGFLPPGQERAEIEAEVAEMEAMVAGALAYFREGRDAEPSVDTDLAAILQTLASEASDGGHDVAYLGPARCVIPLRRVAAKRAIRNLVTNALQHGAPPVRITLRREGRQAVIDVTDRGPGIPANRREQALAPFVRLDPSRGGSGVGLGLTTALRFATAEGGDLELREAELGGLGVRIALPAG